MIKRKQVVLFASLFFVVLFSVNLVSAAYGYFDPRTEMEKLIRIVSDFSSPVLEVTLGEYWTGTNMMLFEKFFRLFRKSDFPSHELSLDVSAYHSHRAAGRPVI